MLRDGAWSVVVINWLKDGRSDEWSSRWCYNIVMETDQTRSLSVVSTRMVSGQC